MVEANTKLKVQFVHIFSRLILKRCALSSKDGDANFQSFLFRLEYILEAYGIEEQSSQASLRKIPPGRN